MLLDDVLETLYLVEPKYYNSRHPVQGKVRDLYVIEDFFKQEVLDDCKKVSAIKLSTLKEIFNNIKTKVIDLSVGFKEIKATDSIYFLPKSKVARFKVRGITPNPIVRDVQENCIVVLPSTVISELTSFISYISVTQITTIEDKPIYARLNYSLLSPELAKVSNSVTTQYVTIMNSTSNYYYGSIDIDIIQDYFTFLDNLEDLAKAGVKFITDINFNKYVDMYNDLEIDNTMVNNLITMVTSIEPEMITTGLDLVSNLNINKYAPIIHTIIAKYNNSYQSKRIKISRSVNVEATKYTVSQILYNSKGISHTDVSKLLFLYQSKEHSMSMSNIISIANFIILCEKIFPESAIILKEQLKIKLEESFLGQNIDIMMDKLRNSHGVSN